MVKEKYQQMIYKSMYENFQKWDELEFVTERQIYYFLHSLKGTAGSIGLCELTTIASEKIEPLNENEERHWSKSEWKSYLAPIIEGISFYQTNFNVQQVENTQLISTDNSYDQEFILIIDDDIVFISYLKDVLEKKGHSVIVAYNGKRGLELIYELKPSIVFLDIMLPDTCGFSILKNVKKIKKDRMFVAVMSSNDCKENRIRAYDMGALDFISKPIEEDILNSYVTNRLAYRKELEQSIIIDELTQIYNRKFMDSQLIKLIQQYNRNKEPFALAIADLDYFKKVNDTYGHLVGDEVLKGFADLVMNSKREQDVFCRYGGEEFVMLMPQTTVDQAYMLLEQLRESMKQKHFTASGARFQVTFSSGVVEATTKNLHPKKILEEADQALYNAKEFGRNQTVMFDSLTAGVQKKIKVKIIVIDDVYIIRNLITTHFENWKSSENFDIEVISYGDGVSFLNSNWYTPNYKYIILLDGMMPEMDGIEVLKKIREKHTSNDVIISMLTGLKGENYVLEALENGADDYIVKPFNIIDVSTRIMSLIKRLFI
ncbi:diguanylate cyclase [Solibacillus sp. R5-41]|uniref:GGDEF domain-containing response regulator n=1 Tax=Solibacillus sp. R5-41 TaxID=2048654 RepID=UPI000C128817|nr:diguanylate cyclase [Solibacillus sp. R5-41]ATP40659.1 diguanylate cyclase [Solibacillus sp. R5-41]